VPLHQGAAGARAVRDHQLTQGMMRDGASKGREGIGAGLLALHRLANPDTRKSGSSSLFVASSSPLCCIHRGSLASIGPITDLIGGLATSANLSRNHALPPPDGYQEAWWDLPPHMGEILPAAPENCDCFPARCEIREFQIQRSQCR
jgi:hypothetical protein